MFKPALPNPSVSHHGVQAVSPNAFTDTEFPMMMLLPENYAIVCDEEGWVLHVSLPMVIDDIIKGVQALYTDLKSWLPPRCQLASLKPVKPEELDRFRDPYGVY